MSLRSAVLTHPPPPPQLGTLHPNLAAADDVGMIRISDMQASNRFTLWLYRALSRRHAVTCIIVTALTLASPSLTVGLLADDYIHQLMLRGSQGISAMSRRPFDLFNFANGSAQVAHQLINEGIFPWWSDPSAVLAFFRPISSWTHWLDYTFWPDSPGLMHLHSLAWFALLLCELAITYRRFETNGVVAVLALLLFAVDDAHGPVVGWIANRNMLIALSLALPALSAHDQWRRKAHLPSALRAVFLLGIGLLAGEAAVAILAYLVAYALVLDGGSKASRLRSLLGYGVVVATWRVVYNGLGYGAIGSGIYLDPGREPLSFAMAMPTRLPVLLLGEFALPWADSWEVFPLVAPRLRGYVLALAYACIGGLLWLWRPLWKADRVFRFWAVGSLLSTLPMCATFPHDRLLMGPGIGGMALLAHFFVGVWTAALNGQKSPLVGLAHGLLLSLHLLLAPALLPLRIRSLLGVDAMFRGAHASIASNAGTAAKTVIILNPPIDPLAAYFVFYSEATHQHRPPHILWLANGITQIRISRVDGRTLGIEPREGFLSNATQHMLRSPARPFHVGEKVTLDTATFEVAAVSSDARPTKVLIRFENDLDSAEFRWLRWGTDGYISFSPPAAGNSELVPAVDMWRALFGRTSWAGA